MPELEKQPEKIEEVFDLIRLVGEGGPGDVDLTPLQEKPIKLEPFPKTVIEFNKIPE